MLVVRVGDASRWEQGKENHKVEHPLNSEASARWLAGNPEAATKAKAVRAARAEAATKIAAATEAEVAFNESIDEAETAHATARALDDAVKAKVDAGESPPIEDLIKREAAPAAQPLMSSPSPGLGLTFSPPQPRPLATALMPMSPTAAPSPLAR